MNGLDSIRHSLLLFWPLNQKKTTKRHALEFDLNISFITLYCVDVVDWMDGGDDDSGDDGGSQPKLLKRNLLLLYFQNSMNEKGNSRMLCQCRFNSLSPFY